jgi:hypothetical protein
VRAALRNDQEENLIPPTLMLRVENAFIAKVMAP